MRRAELNGEWAKAAQERAPAKEEATRKKELATADELLRQAAERHTEVAKLLSDKGERSEDLWLSALRSYEGHDYPRADAKLKEIVVPRKGERRTLERGLVLAGRAPAVTLATCPPPKALQSVRRARRPLRRACPLSTGHARD